MRRDTAAPSPHDRAHLRDDLALCRPVGGGRCLGEVDQGRDVLQAVRRLGRADLAVEQGVGGGVVEGVLVHVDVPIAVGTLRVTVPWESSGASAGRGAAACGPRRVPAQDLGHLLDVQPAHDPQQQHLGLVGRQVGEQGLDRLLVAEPVHDDLGRLGDATPVGLALEGDQPGSAGGRSVVVGDATSGDGEEEGAEGVDPALERGEALGRTEPGLRGEVLGGVGGLVAQVAQQGRLQGPVQGRDGLLVAGSCEPEGSAEVSGLH